MNWKIGVVLLMIFQCEISWGETPLEAYAKKSSPISQGSNNAEPSNHYKTQFLSSPESVNNGVAPVNPPPVDVTSPVTANPPVHQPEDQNVGDSYTQAQMSKSEAAQAAINEAIKIMSTEMSGNPLLEKGWSAIEQKVLTCKSGIDYANICIAGTNPGLLTAAGAIGVLLQGADMLKMSDACSKMNKALDVGKMALTAYNTACSAAHMYCSSSCTDLLKSVQSTGSSAVNKIQETVTLCDSYKLNMAAAAGGILQTVMKSKNMDQCKSATTIANCALDPSNPLCPKPLDCTKPANAQNATCICLASPNSPGCPGAVVSNTGTPQYGVDGKGNGLAPTKENGGPTSSVFGEEPGFVSPTSGSGSAGKSAGFGAGSGGGGAGGLQGGGSGATKEAKNDQRKVMNSNILGGFDSGGGGGGSGGGRSSSVPASSGLRAYMPGGAKDPSRSLASQTFGNGEVTAAGAKSNWEKIRDRYVENKPSLMGP